jgi:hypothetical protein
MVPAEASWNDLGRYLSAAPPRLVIPAERDLYGPFFLHNDYLFAVDWQGHPTGLRQPALLYVDLRDALRAGQHSWRKIDYLKGELQSRSRRRFPSKRMTSSSPSSGERRILSPPGLPPQPLLMSLFFPYGLSCRFFFVCCKVYRQSTERRRKPFFGL